MILHAYISLNISPQIKYILRFYIYQCLFHHLFWKCRMDTNHVVVMNETTMIPALMELGARQIKRPKSNDTVKLELSKMRTIILSDRGSVGN